MIKILEKSIEYNKIDEGIDKINEFLESRKPFVISVSEQGFTENGKIYQRVAVTFEDEEIVDAITPLKRHELIIKSKEKNQKKDTIQNFLNSYEVLSVCVSGFKNPKDDEYYLKYVVYALDIPVEEENQNEQEQQ